MLPKRFYLSLSAMLLSPSLFAHSAGEPSGEIAQYLQEQFTVQRRNNDTDLLAQTAPTDLDLDARPAQVEWQIDGVQNRAKCILSQKENATSHVDFDYGEANDLSDGLQHIDLPKHKSRQIYQQTLVPSGKWGNQPPYAVKNDASLSLSISSDCFE